MPARHHHRRRLLLAGAAAGAWPPLLRAAPTTRLIVPYPPGGTSDQIARLLAEAMSGPLGSTVYVDNRPGASGTLGTQVLARAAPDGRTLGLGTVSTLVLLPRHRDTGYDPQRSFEPVGAIAQAPLLVVVTPALGVGDLRALRSLLKARPGAYDYASVGEASLPHVAGLRYQALTGTKIEHIPYTGAPAARLDLLAGRVQLMFDQLATFSAATLAGGALRALAVTAAQRLPALPAVPTVAEAGLPGLLAQFWIGMLAPAGTPVDRVAVANAALQAALGSKPVREAFDAVGLAPAGGSAAEFERHIAAQLASDLAGLVPRR